MGNIPEDVVRDMADIAPMLSVLGYDPFANPPDYGKPDAWVEDNTSKVCAAYIKILTNFHCVRVCVKFLFRLITFFCFVFREFFPLFFSFVLCFVFSFFALKSYIAFCVCVLNRNFLLMFVNMSFRFFFLLKIFTVNYEVLVV